jgi:hypothetical protein
VVHGTEKDAQEVDRGIDADGLAPGLEIQKEGVLAVSPIPTAGLLMKRNVEKKEKGVRMDLKVVR